MSGSFYMRKMENTAKQFTDPNTAIALMGKDIEYIRRDVSNINLTLEKVSNVFATKEEVKEINIDTEKRLVALEERKSLWKYLNPLLSALVSSVVTFLLISYLESRGGGI